jgi:hypothetical protein
MNESKIFSPESGPKIPTKEEVVSMFKEQGETLEAIKKYTEWFDAKHKEADESQSEYSRLKFNIEVAGLLLEAGMKQDAGEYMDGAWDIVENEVGRVGVENMSEELKALEEGLITLGKMFDSE